MALLQHFNKRRKTTKTGWNNFYIKSILQGTGVLSQSDGSETRIDGQEVMKKEQEQKDETEVEWIRKMMWENLSCLLVSA